MIDMRIVDALVDWMVRGAPGENDAGSIVARICDDLKRAGVPIARVGVYIYALSPTGSGRRYLWSPDDGVAMSEGAIGLFLTRAYLANPLPHVVAEQRAIRRRLADPACPDDYPILSELRAEGFTDYFVQPLLYLTGGCNVVSWSSQAPGGFDDAAIAVLERINGPISRLTEALVLYLNATAVVSAYVGRNSGERVLSGSIHRGDGEEIDAAILFTDLIGFTELSDGFSGPQTVQLLNDTFDAAVPPIEHHGGEILKYTGDGFLAIFPYDEAGGERAAVRAARQAFLDAETALAAAPAGASATFRSALHAGRFHYGNIGGGSRLDFTAVGRPINYAARLLAAAGDLGLRRVVSEHAAGFIDGATPTVATVALKGFEGQHAIHAY